MTPQQRLYYEFVNDKLVPYWYVVTFNCCEIPWHLNSFNFQVIAPFQFMERDEFDENIISATIFISDLIINQDRRNELGINLKKIKDRLCNQYRLDPYLVRQFVIQMPDIEEVLQLVPNHRKKTFIMN